MEGHNCDLQALKASISQLPSPPILWGFKSTASIHAFVPGSHPLQERIITFLTERAGENVCDRQFVHAFATSVYASTNDFIPRHVVDLSADSAFVSANKANQCLGYDFKEDQRIVPSHYAIRSVVRWRISRPHLKLWAIEVTNDRSNESSSIEIDRRTDNQDLNDPGIVQTFTISRPPSDELRYIRIRQIVNHNGTQYLGVSGLEFFGWLWIQAPL
jgi:hypothetical protein